MRMSNRGGDVQRRMSKLFVAKTEDCARKLRCVYMDTDAGRVRQCGYFAKRGKSRFFFAILCGRLLWTVFKHFFILLVEVYLDK